MEQTINKLVQAVVMALNSEKGTEIMKTLLDESLKQNPDLTNEEWQEIKKNFINLVVKDVVNANPDLLKIEK